MHKGLGEMQTLATGVGDLKRVLTNVKSRGGWGEVQLGMLLEDMLTPDQFASNVAVQPGLSAERVEYAVKLPGKGEGEPPMATQSTPSSRTEDYDRLLTAQEAGIAEEMERAALALERAVRLQAKTICAKYVHPPHSTDFAIMYLPTEGLFAEVIRRPGLMMELQQNQRVMITGPTTLSAILNSLQMGFRSVAIEKRSSEVWQVLGKAKAEFRKYGEVWDRLGKQLAAAQNTVADGGKRHPGAGAQPAPSGDGGAGRGRSRTCCLCPWLTRKTKRPEASSVTLCKPEPQDYYHRRKPGWSC